MKRGTSAGADTLAAHFDTFQTVLIKNKIVYLTSILAKATFLENLIKNIVDRAAEV